MPDRTGKLISTPSGTTPLLRPSVKSFANYWPRAGGSSSKSGSSWLAWTCFKPKPKNAVKECHLSAVPWRTINSSGSWAISVCSRGCSGLLWDDATQFSSGVVVMTSNSAFSWKAIVARYQKPSTGRGTWQIINTLAPYAALWVLMYFTAHISWWLTAPLAVLAAGFMVRTFIIFHDCGHGSFFKSQRANHILGTITGFLTFTPYFHWRWEHALHHATSGDLDRRGTGDIWTLTVQEYLESSRWKRFAYRLARNPMVLFLFAPLYLFLVKERFVMPRAGMKERLSVYLTNIALAAMAIGLSWVFGWQTYLIIQLIIVGVATSAGVWLF